MRVRAFEKELFQALLRLGDKAYGMNIWQELEERTEGPVAVGAVYATLERLERKGYVSSHLGAATAERGGRAKRYYSITGTGALALQQSGRPFMTLRPLATGAEL